MGPKSKTYWNPAARGHLAAASLLSKAAEAVDGDKVTHYGPDGKITKVEKRAPDGRLALKLLALRYPAEFAEKVVVENRHTGASGTGPVAFGTISPAALRGMTPDQLRALVTDPAAAGGLEPRPDDQEGEDE